MIDTQKMGHPSEMPVGNEAKLRETLVAVKKSIDEIGASSLDGDPEILMMSLTQVCARLSARIDAALAAPATAENSSAVGDSAKLREAMKHIQNLADALDLNEPNVIAILDTCRDALSAPPRNCDRFATVDEAMDDFGDEALIEEWNALKAGKDRDMLAEEIFAFAKWLYAPATAKDGGAK